MSKPLPGDLAPPLHLLEPLPLGTLLLLAFLIGLLVFSIIRRRRRRPAAPARPVPPATEPKRSIPRFESRVRELEARHRKTESFREGCFELHELTRRRWESTGRIRSSSRTAREIHQRLGDRPLSTFLLALADLRFGSTEPTDDTFKEVCDLAVEADRSRSGDASS